jgi:hypothetical protein
VRLWLFILAYNLWNLLRRLGLPKAIKVWSPRSPSAEGHSAQGKLIKIGGRLVRHARRPRWHRGWLKWLCRER